MAAADQGVQALYEDHHGWLVVWLRRRLGCIHTADDLAQDTFLRLMNSQPRAVPLREPRAFLTTIANGLLINLWRRRDIERAYLDALAMQPEAFAPSPEVQALTLELLVAVDALLDRLKPKVRSAFLMAQLDGMTYGEIAAQLGVSDRMVRRYMAEAMFHCLRVAADPA